MKLIIGFFLICCSLPSFSYSQDMQLVDSLVKQLMISKQDTIKADILYQLAKAYWGNDPFQATVYSKQTLQLSEKTNYKKGIANAYNSLGAIASDSGNSKTAMAFYEKSLKIRKEIGDKPGIASSFHNIGSIYRDEGNYETALKNYIAALNALQDINDKYALGMVYNNIGTTYEYCGDYPKAFNYYFKSLKVKEEIGDKSGIAASYNNIGNVYASQQKDSISLAYHLKALKIQENIGDKTGAAISYTCIGAIYSTLGNDTAAIKNHLIALKIQERIGNKLLIANIYKQIAESFRKLENYDEALKNCFLSLKISKDIGEQSGIAYTSNAIGYIYTKQKNYAKASTYLNHALKIGQNIGSLQLVNDSYEMLTALETERGNFKQALDYYRLFINSRDSMINEKNNEKMLQQQIQYEFDKKEVATKVEQQKKDLLMQQQLQRQKIIRNSFIAGSILLLLLIVLLINRNKLKRSIEMEKMRSRLSRDLHDDIGSTLSSINILSRTAQNSLHQTVDEKTKSSLEKINDRSQRLLDSMSDIIWNINPGNDTIEEVMSRMREYATTILEARNIDYTFNFPKEKLDCTLTMEVKNNMYLIFKEAVNNLSKYSGATHATLSLTFDEKNIHLIVEDNGKGFNDSEIKHRGGLSNMQYRAEVIKGVIKINSVFEKGTKIELTMPRYC